MAPFLGGLYRPYLSYLVLLYSGCYRLPNIAKSRFGRDRQIVNKVTIYAANMDIILSHSTIHLKGKRIPAVLKRAYSISALYYPEKVSEIQKLFLDILDETDKQTPDPEVIGGLYGNLFALVFSWRDDEYSSDFSNLGYSLGKYSYLTGLFQSLKKDEKRNIYNPLAIQKRKEPEVFDTYFRQRLLTLCDSCMDSLERLPLREEYEDVIKNSFSQYLASQYLQR